MGAKLFGCLCNESIYNDNDFLLKGSQCARKYLKKSIDNFLHSLSLYVPV